MKIDNSKEILCDYNDFKRARYFDGEILNKLIFDTEQAYHNKKRKLLNRMLHGWGIVCGLNVTPTDIPSSKILIKSGLAIDCHGNEILACGDETVDLSAKLCLQKTNKNSCISDTSASQETTLYVVIKFAEIVSDPVPSYAPSNDCSGKTCDYSMMREGFCIEVQDAQPPEPTYTPNTPCNALLTCPTCCPDPHYILLATLTLKGQDVIIADMIQNTLAGLSREKLIKENMEKQLEEWKTEMHKRIESATEEIKASTEKIGVVSIEMEKIKTDMAKKQDIVGST